MAGESVRLRVVRAGSRVVCGRELFRSGNKSRRILYVSLLQGLWRTASSDADVLRRVACYAAFRRPDYHDAASDVFQRVCRRRGSVLVLLEQDAQYSLGALYCIVCACGHTQYVLRILWLGYGAGNVCRAAYYLDSLVV